MVNIREATIDDIARILELYEQLAQGGAKSEAETIGPPGDFVKAFTEIKNLPGCEIIVAEEDGVVTGTAMLMVVPNLSHNALPWAIVENVVVDSTSRRTGTGKLLMEHCAAKAKEAGCYKVQLLSHKTRQEAHKFYESIGYTASAEGFRLYL